MMTAILLPVHKTLAFGLLLAAVFGFSPRLYVKDSSRPLKNSSGSSITDGSAPSASPTDPATLKKKPARGQQGGSGAPVPSFVRAPFINPVLVMGLQSIGDSGVPRIVSYSLLESDQEFYGDFKFEVSNDGSGSPCIKIDNRETKEWFSYKLVGTASSDVHILHVIWCGGGTGIFNALLFVKVTEEMAISVDKTNNTVSLNKKRLLLTKLGEIPLGDRWAGKLRLEGDRLIIGKDEGWYGQTAETDDPEKNMGDGNKKEITLKLEFAGGMRP